MGDRPLSGVLLSLSVIVMLGVGDGCLYTDCLLGGCSELWTLILWVSETVLSHQSTVMGVLISVLILSLLLVYLHLMVKPF